MNYGRKVGSPGITRWLWPSPIGATKTLAVGYLASRLILSSHRENTALTSAEVMKRQEPARTKVV